MTTVKHKSNDVNADKIGDDIEPRTPKASARSASQGRPLSASGGPRSKIPTNINQNRGGSSLVDSQVSSASREDTTTGGSPQNNPARRLASRSFNSALSKSKSSSIPAGMQKRSLENQFSTKKNHYLKMKKELAEKQKCVQQMYEDMSQLREQLITVGKDPGKVEGIKLTSDYSTNQSGDQNICRSNGEHGFVLNGSITKDFVAALENDLREYPKNCLTLCEDVIKKHCEILKWVENFMQKHCLADLEINKQLENYKRDMETLKTRLETTKKLLDDCNTALVKKIMIMWTEIERLQLRIKDLEIMGDDMVNNWQLKLNAEMEKFNQLQEKKTLVDGDLAKAKITIQNLENRANADETKMNHLQAHIKTLEAQLKQKDISFENRTLDLTNSLKSAEEMIDNLEHQRENLESRFIELKKGKRNDMEKSPRPQSATKRDEDHDHYRDSQKKVLELETVVEALRRELESHKGLIAKIQTEKSSNEMYLKEQLEREQAHIKKMSEDHEQLKKDHESMQRKIKCVDSQFMAIYPKQYDSKDTGKTGWSPTEIPQLHQDLYHEIAELRQKNKELEFQLRQQNEKLKTQDQMIGYLHQKTSNGKNLGVRHSRPRMQEEEEIAAKAEVLEQLYSTLEEKQMQVSRLEILVKQMEKQEMRAQEQRTRLEKRIAQLELALQSRTSKDYRNKRFSIL